MLEHQVRKKQSNRQARSFKYGNWQTSLTNKRDAARLLGARTACFPFSRSERNDVVKGWLFALLRTREVCVLAGRLNLNRAFVVKVVMAGQAGHNHMYTEPCIPFCDTFAEC